MGTGLSDDERREPPQLGAVITFRYQELTDDGVPRFPSYVGVRVDVELPSARRRRVEDRQIAAKRRAAGFARAKRR